MIADVARLSTTIVVTAVVVLSAAAAPLPAGPIARLGNSDFRTQGHSIALSPDGHRAALCVGSTIEVMSMNSGKVVATIRSEKKLRHPMQNEYHEPHFFSYAFTAGGKEIVTASGETEVWLWDAATGEPLRSIPGPKQDDGKPGQVNTVYNCQTSDVVIATCPNGVYRFDPTKGRWKHVKRGVTISQVSANGEWVTMYEDCASVENFVSMYSTTSGGAGGYEGKSAGDYPFEQAPAPDGKFVASVEDKAGVQCWQVFPMREIALENAKEVHGTASFSPDGAVLFVCVPDYKADDRRPYFARWDVASGKRLPDWKMPADVLTWAVDHKNNGLVVVAGRVVFRVDIPTGQFALPPGGFLDTISAAISPDGKTAVLGDRAGVIRVWTAPFVREPKTIPAAGSAIDDLAFSADGRVLVVAYADRTAALRDTSTWQVGAVLEAAIDPPRYPSWSDSQRIAVSPDGKLVSSAVDGKRIWTWDAATGKVIWRFPARPPLVADVSRCRPVYDADGQSLFCGGPNCSVYRFAARTGEQLGVLGTGDADKRNVTRLAVSRDGRRIAAVINHEYISDATRIDVRDIDEDRANSVESDADVDGLAFSPDGSMLLTFHPDGTLRGRDALDPEKSRFVLSGPAGDSNGIQLTADGKYAITDSSGGYAVVWKLALDR